MKFHPGQRRDVAKFGRWIFKQVWNSEGRLDSPPKRRQRNHVGFVQKAAGKRARGGLSGRNVESGMFSKPNAGANYEDRGWERARAALKH